MDSAIRGGHAPVDPLCGSTTQQEKKQRQQQQHDDDDDDDDGALLTAYEPLVVQRYASSPFRRTTRSATTEPIEYQSLVCGLLAGVAQAAVFHPYDRALYLSVKDHRRFLSLKNWKRPYTGFFQSIGGRALSGSLYFPLEHLFLRSLNADDSSNPHHQQQQHHWTFLAGTAAGAVNACILNPLSAVKYKTWSQSASKKHRKRAAAAGGGKGARIGMWNTVAYMWTKSGFSLRPFFRGMAPTVCRDVVFGGCYTSTRLKLQSWLQLEPHQYWIANGIAAAMATVVSGPFNYCRVQQYGTPSAQPSAASIADVLKELLHDAKAQEGGAIDKLRFLQKRLRIGWGTTRVALGMAFGHAVYDWFHEHITELREYNHNYN